MKQRTIFIVELVGGITACVGVAMFSVASALVVAGTLIVVACEANS